MTRKSSNQSTDQPTDIPIPPGHMRFGLTAWKQTPLAVKLAYLETQKTIQEMEGENQQLREQRDRLREASRSCIRYGLSRAETHLAFVSSLERRLVARCARLKRAFHIERGCHRLVGKHCRTVQIERDRALVDLKRTLSELAVCDVCCKARLRDVYEAQRIARKGWPLLRATLGTSEVAALEQRCEWLCVDEKGR